MIRSQPRVNRQQRLCHCRDIGDRNAAVEHSRFGQARPEAFQFVCSKIPILDLARQGRSLET
jgi:hypothetical protein